MKSQNRLNKAISEQQLPSEEEEWQQHDVIRIYGTSDSYENGMRKLQAAEETSNVDTDGNNTDSQEKAKMKRRQRARRHFSSSDESESDTERCSILPPFPLAKLKQSEGYSSPLVKRVLDSDKKTLINDERHSGTPKRKREEETSSHKRLTPKGIETSSPRNLLQSQEDSPSTTQNASRNEFRKLVLSKLNTLLKRTERIEERIAALEQLGCNNNAGDSESEEDGIGLPLTNLGELNIFEEKLKTDTNYFKKMINVLKRIGGSDINNITYGILKKLLSNSLAEQFSWVGFKGKKSFKELRIAHLITKTVRIHKNTSTDDVIIEPISKWLAQAKLRASREVEKRKKRSENCSVETE